ncbi:hypothetical protein [Blastococcus sp. SYSU DS0828]
MKRVAEALVEIRRPLSEVEIARLFALAKEHGVTLTIGWGSHLGIPSPSATLGKSIWTANGAPLRLLRFLWKGRGMAKWTVPDV